MENFLHKKQIATAPMCRGSFVSGDPYRSLGCQSQSAKIMSSRSPVMNLFSIVTITLLSYSHFTLVLYAFGFYFASFNLDIFHSFLLFVFNHGNVHIFYHTILRFSQCIYLWSAPVWAVSVLHIWKGYIRISDICNSVSVISVLSVALHNRPEQEQLPGDLRYSHC